MNTFYLPICNFQIFRYCKEDEIYLFAAGTEGDEIKGAKVRWILLVPKFTDYQAFSQFIFTYLWFILIPATRSRKFQAKQMWYKKLRIIHEKYINLTTDTKLWRYKITAYNSSNVQVEKNFIYFYVCLKNLICARRI